MSAALWALLALNLVLLYFNVRAAMEIRRQALEVAEQIDEVNDLMEQARTLRTVPAAVPADWARKDMSVLIYHLRSDTNFDADLVEQMLAFAQRAALATSAPPAAVPADLLERLKVQSGLFKGKPQQWFTRAEVIALATYAPTSPAGMPASEYLAKVEADPRRAAALQRARERATSTPPPVEAREPLPPLPEPVFVVQGSGLRTPMGFSAKQMLDYVRADRAATHPEEPTP